VVFGTRILESEREVVGVVLAGVTPHPAKWEITTLDGSVLRAQEVILENIGLQADGKPLLHWIGMKRVG